MARHMSGNKEELRHDAEVVIHLASPYSLAEWDCALDAVVGPDTAMRITQGAGLDLLVSPLSARRLDELFI